MKIGSKKDQPITYDEELFAHFEKRYFHEVERKDHMFQRLNIPLAAIIAISGFYAVIFSLDLKSVETGWLIWFWIIAAISLLFMLAGFFFFVEALLGNMDKALPTPQDIDDWKHKLVEYYKDEEDAKNTISSTIREHLFISYMSCTTVVSINNEIRANSLYRCNIFLVLAAAVAVGAYSIVKFTS
ncbi:MAG: hypothetical protein QNL70_01395 [Pseudomonas sp.]